MILNIIEDIICTLLLSYDLVIASWHKIEWHIINNWTLILLFQYHRIDRYYLLFQYYCGSSGRRATSVPFDVRPYNIQIGFVGTWAWKCAQKMDEKWRNATKSSKRDGNQNFPRPQDLTVGTNSYPSYYRQYEFVPNASRQYEFVPDRQYEFVPQYTTISANSYPRHHGQYEFVPEISPLVRIRTQSSLTKWFEIWTEYNHLNVEMVQV